MEFSIADQKAHGIIARELLRLQGIFEAFDASRTQPERRVLNDRCLNEQPGRSNRLKGITVYRIRIRHPDPLFADIHVKVGDACPRSLRNLNDALSGQSLDGSPDRLSTDEQHIGKFPFAWEFVADLQNPRSD